MVNTQKFSEKENWPNKFTQKCLLINCILYNFAFRKITSQTAHQSNNSITIYDTDSKET